VRGLIDAVCVEVESGGGGHGDRSFSAVESGCCLVLLSVKHSRRLERPGVEYENMSWGPRVVRSANHDAGHDANRGGDEGRDDV